MCPPKGWVSPYVVGKLKKYAYCLVESGRIWQLLIDGWLSKVGIYQVPGLPHIFVQCNSCRRIQIAF